MNAFTPEEHEALRALRGLWGDAKISLVGAAALASQMPGFQRQTNDLDVTVAVPLNELPSEIHKLPGWQRHSRFEQRWLSPAGIVVDIIPAGPELLRAGRIRWPSGHEMSLLGFRHAFSNVHPLALGAGQSVNVAAVEVIALLKVVAYLDRPEGRTKDLGDLAFILEQYLPDTDPRRFSDFDNVLAAGISFEAVSAYMLGRDLSAIVNEEEQSALQSFIARVNGEGDGGHTQALMLQQGPAYWREHPEELSETNRALRLGLAREKPAH